MPAHVSAPACFEGVKKKKVRKGDAMTNNLLDTPKLGFGLMRLPTVEGNPDLIDHEQVCRMVDMFMEAGLTYYDTAFVYGKDGASEKAARACLVDRYPRESFTLATKINAWLMAEDEQAAKAQFYTSLERTGAGYFDFYLLHALQSNTYKKYDEYHLWDYVADLKKQGLIKNMGFSFHASPELLEQVLTDHPEVDFVQLQLNYADWENPSVTSRANYEVARRHNKPIVVMEPVKGGTLANPPAPVRRILEEADPNASMASWAIRYIASLPGILTILSGMSNVEQMADNLSYMRKEAFHPLSGAEQETMRRAQEALAAIPSIPCTGCSYCEQGCPMNIPIPDIFDARNRQMVYGKIEEGQNVKYAIVLCRVSDLEHVNETKGHEAGDQLLRNACDLICNTFKHSPVFRVAGDEFAVIAQGHDYATIDSLILELIELSSDRELVISCGMAKYDRTQSVASVFARAEHLCGEN